MIVIFEIFAIIGLIYGFTKEKNFIAFENKIIDYFMED